VSLLVVRDHSSGAAHLLCQPVHATTTALASVVSSLQTGGIMEPGQIPAAQVSNQFDSFGKTLDESFGEVFSAVEAADELSSAIICPELLATTNVLVPECFSYAQLANLAVKRKESSNSFSGAGLSSFSKAVICFAVLRTRNH